MGTFNFKDKNGNQGTVEGINATDYATLNDLIEAVNIIGQSSSARNFIDSLLKKDLSNLSSSGETVIAHKAMPSDRHIELTLGVSASQYVMPADGYIYISKLHNNAFGGKLQVVVHTASNFYDVSVDNIAYGASFLVPVLGQSTVEINYDLNGNTNAFCFIYAEGVSLGA